MTKFQKENILISVAGKEHKSPNPSVAQGEKCKIHYYHNNCIKSPLWGFRGYEKT